MTDLSTARYIMVDCEPRYWEDASVNDVNDDDGGLIPFRSGDDWKPIIDIRDGRFVDWPQGTTACIHYKVCDQGQYWLMDYNGHKLAKWKGCYVPDEFLCHGDNGYGDYIIMEVDADGFINQFSFPEPDPEQWEPCNG